MIRFTTDTHRFGFAENLARQAGSTEEDLLQIQQPLAVAEAVEFGTHAVGHR